MAELNEAVADVAEEVAEQALGVAEVSRSLSGRGLTIGFVVGLAVGGGLGFYFTRKQLETKYERLAEREIDEMREHFRKKSVAQEDKPSISGLDEKLDELDYTPPKNLRPTPGGDGPKGPPGPQLAPVPEPENVFEHAQVEGIEEEDGWDYQAEIASRSPEKPYVIHIDEQGETDYDAICLVLYEDDVLCDDNNNVVDVRQVGAENLEKFGHGSKDPEIVWIRNDALALDIEVHKSDKTYLEEVHGFTHGDPPRRRHPDWDE
jgi:hypothetical protein